MFVQWQCHLARPSLELIGIGYGMCSVRRLYQQDTESLYKIQSAVRMLPCCWETGTVIVANVSHSMEAQRKACRLRQCVVVEGAAGLRGAENSLLCSRALSGMRAVQGRMTQWHARCAGEDDTVACALCRGG